MAQNCLLRYGLILLALLVAFAEDCQSQDTLESRLKRQPITELARESHIFGDAQRGALHFYQPGLGCVLCHDPAAGKQRLGPDLSLMRERATYQHVIESLLDPSKAIQDDFQSQRILLEDGRIVSGILERETDEQLVLVIPGEEKPLTLAKEQIQARRPAGSIMPAGLINQLDDEQDFFDLVCFLVELGTSGKENTQRLKHKAQSLGPPPLPEYENNLDHRGLISNWNDRGFERGEKTYRSLCVNCHGTRENPGSLPNALRFASGKFRNGSDPWSMYKTLTHGFKMMLPQRQLVPREKYDVIHYIREDYLKPHNPAQYVEIDDAYLASLPQGKLRGPEPMRKRPWSEMDYGPFLTHTYELVDESSPPRPEVTEADRDRARRDGRPAERTWHPDTNFAYKGVAVQLDQSAGGISRGNRFLIFEHDTMRVAGAWSGSGFIDWQGILLDGRHWRSPRTIGEMHFQNRPRPGWANPSTGSFDDPRWRARDGQAYGPMPKDWMTYRGIYKHGHRVVFSYTVGDAEILESHRVEENSVEENSAPDSNPRSGIDWVRVLNIGRSTRDLAVLLAPQGTVRASINGPSGTKRDVVDGQQILRIPASITPVDLEIYLSRDQSNTQHVFAKNPENLRPFTTPGPNCWPQIQSTETATGTSSEAFAVDELVRPTKNPWNSRLRMSGLDFFSDGDSMVACCCDGDVWIIRGISQVSTPQQPRTLSWKRIASGLFHPLGIKIVDGKIHVSCRDQIVVLHDMNGDQETDFYECFNQDHQVTEHFHEFAMGLQSDAQGNLYYAKSARHAQDSLVPQHGTLLRVSADGGETTILANGFRAANGVCLNPDGSFFVTDQEGHWTPMNRINRVVKGGFYGNMYSYGAPSDNRDSAMQQPLCWPNKSFDRSPSELLWVESNRWGDLNGSLLSLSYGYGKVFVVPHESIHGEWQGAMCRLPLPDFETGIMRARFHSDGHLYACGMTAWGSNQTASPGGLYRIRATGKPMYLPKGFQTHHGAITLQMTDPINPDSAIDPANYLIETWDLRRTANYGSDTFNEQELQITDVALSDDGKTIRLTIPDLQPTWTIQIAYKLRGTSGESFSRVMQGTIHELGN